MKFLGHMKINVAPCDWLNIASASGKAKAKVLKRISPSLNIGEYGKYDTIIANPAINPGPSRFDAVGAVLKEYYNKPPSKLATALSSRRNEHDLEECPYCGNPFSPDTLDHFLPKDEWPEFSIFPNNLVPQCRGCAPIKGSRFICPVAGTHLFLHPIYSSLISKTKFNITVTHTPATTKFAVSFHVPTSTSPDELKAITSHIKALKITDRAPTYCKSYLRHWQRLAALNYFDVRSAFNARLNEHPSENRHLNWKMAFFVGMLACDDAMDALQSECPAPQSASAPSLGVQIDL